MPRSERSYGRVGPNLLALVQAIGTRIFRPQESLSSRAASEGALTMQGQIVAVFVDDTEVPLDRDLIDQGVFDVITSRGNRYRVVKDTAPASSFVWDVSLVEESGLPVGVKVGRVTGVQSLFARNPTSFAYLSTQHLLDSGNQNDFLNAVQSLTE